MIHQIGQLLDCLPGLIQRFPIKTLLHPPRFVGLASDAFPEEPFEVPGVSFSRDSENPQEPGLQARV